MTVSQPSKDKLQKQITEGLSVIQRLGDEIRVRTHLLGMDLKDVWSKLEERIVNVQLSAKNSVSEVTQKAVRELEEALKTFREKLES